MLLFFNGGNVDFLLTYFPSNNIVDDNYYNYFNWVYDFTQGNAANIDLAQVQALANSCPNKNGDVVFYAQDLYNKLTNTVNDFNNDCEITYNRATKPKIIRQVNIMPQSINIFPNPATVSVNVVGKQIQTIKVIGILGNVLIEQNANNENYCTIDISKLQKGMYIVQAIQKDGSCITSKLIKE